MRATLRITAGPYAGRKIALREGQLAQFGRTEWADFSFPADAAMADVHFSVESRGRQCLLRDLQSAAGTQVDDQPVSQIVLQTGMTITAGGTCFLVLLGDEVWPPARVGIETAMPGPPEGSTAEAPLLPLAVKAALSEPAMALALEAKTQPQLIVALQQQKLHDDALALIAAWLTKPQAVAWVCRCLRLLVAKIGQPKLNAANESALSLAERWAAQPNDGLGREAEAAAGALKHQTPAAWAALAAHYSGSSLAPPTSDPVPPPEGLSVTAIHTALLLAVAKLAPAQARAAREEFIQMGLAAAQTNSQ